jgi:hypothetical protein
MLPIARRFIVAKHQFIRQASTSDDKIAPKKFERTPVGRLEEEPKKKDDEEGAAPRRRIVNEETGEIGGPQGPEPTRYGDWERKGRVSDF